MLKKFKRSLGQYFFGADNDASDMPEALLQDEAMPKFNHLSDRLNYAAWDEEHQLFCLDMKDGTNNKSLGVGFTIEVNPLIGAGDEDMALLLSLFQLLPEHCGLQVMTYACPNIDRFLSEYQGLQNARGDTELGKLFSVLAQKRVEFWRSATTETIFTGLPIRLRDFRVALSVNLTKVDPLSKVEMDEASAIRQQVISQLQSAGMYGYAWKPKDLISWTRDMLNPARMQYGKDRDLEDKYDSAMPIRDQVVYPNTFSRLLNIGEEVRFGFEEHGDAVSMRSYSVKQYPNNRPFHLARMRMLIGDPNQINLNYQCPFLLVMNMIKDDYEKTKSSTVLKAAEANRRSTQQMARYLPEMQEKAEDWALAQASYNDNSGGIVRMFNQVVLFDTPDNIIASENAAMSIWRANGLDLAPDKYLHMQSLLCAMPMALDSDLREGLAQSKRFTTKTLLNTVCCSPFLGEWGGVGIPTIGLFGRNGQAMSFDIFSNPSGNYNMAVMGTSGSGKSFFLNELVRNLLGSGARGFILDLGRSYQALCKFVKGQFIEFNDTSNIVLNPFDMVKDIEEDLGMLKLLISTMVAPKTGVSDYESSRIEVVILRVWEAKGILGTLDDVAIGLINYTNEHGERDPDINRLGSQMHPFTSKGIYGSWFKGVTNINIDNELVVLEMDDLQDKPDLQKVIIKLVLYLITQTMYESRDRKKFVVIDEAWNLLDGGEDSAKFINEGFRKVRKYQGAFITATQSAKDYSMSPAAEAALQHADWVVALRGKEQTVEELGARLHLNEFQKNQIRSLKTIQGVFSELWINYPGGSGVGRLYSDPYNQLMSSTRHQDFEAIRIKESQGMGIEQALDAVLSDRAAGEAFKKQQLLSQ